MIQFVIVGLLVHLGLLPGDWENWWRSETEMWRGAWYWCVVRDDRQRENQVSKPMNRGNGGLKKRRRVVGDGSGRIDLCSRAVVQCVVCSVFGSSNYM